MLTAAAGLSHPTLSFPPPPGWPASSCRLYAMCMHGSHALWVAALIWHAAIGEHHRSCPPTSRMGSAPARQLALSRPGSGSVRGRGVGLAQAMAPWPLWAARMRNAATAACDGVVRRTSRSGCAWLLASPCLARYKAAHGRAGPTGLGCWLARRGSLLEVDHSVEVLAFRASGDRATALQSTTWRW